MKAFFNSMTVISTPETLAGFLNGLPPFPKYVAVDTEFVRTRTYWPQVCLIQIAVPCGETVQAVAIDPLQGMDLEPLWAFLRRPDILKVLHAARQDFEGFLYLTGEFFTPFFDTQIASMVYTTKDSVSYEELVNTLLGETVDKTHRVVNWKERPITPERLHYALHDVVYLAQLYPIIAKQLKEWGREAWIQEPLKELLDPKIYTPDFGEAWKKVKGWATIRNLNPRSFLLLHKIAAWREKKASEKNVSRRFLLDDQDICQYVSAFQKNAAFLEDESGASYPIKEAVKEFVKTCVREVQEVPSESLPLLPRKRDFSLEEKALLQTLTEALQEASTKSCVAQKFIATRDDLQKLIRNYKSPEWDPAREPLLTGWRHEVFGKTALEKMG